MKTVLFFLTIFILASSINVFAQPSSPILVQPPQNGTGVSRAPTYKWNASSGATSYHIQVSTVKDFSTLTNDVSGIQGTQYSPDNSLAANTTYYWRVNATNGDGTSSWSTIWYFTTGT